MQNVENILHDNEDLVSHKQAKFNNTSSSSGANYLLATQYSEYNKTLQLIQRNKSITNNIILIANMLSVVQMSRSHNHIIIIMMIGICIAWNKIINANRTTEIAKHRVIHALEHELPLKPFTKEWHHIPLDRKDSIYAVEQIMPRFFITIYLLIIIAAILTHHLNIKIY